MTKNIRFLLLLLSMGFWCPVQLAASQDIIIRIDGDGEVQQSPFRWAPEVVAAASFFCGALGFIATQHELAAAFAASSVFAFVTMSGAEYNFKKAASPAAKIYLKSMAGVGIMSITMAFAAMIANK